MRLEWHWVFCPADNWKVQEVQQSGVRQQDIHLYSVKECKWKLVCAQVWPEIEYNWIDRRIVRRLHLKSRQDDMLMEGEFEGKRFQSTGKIVDLVCAQETTNKPPRHRFYIVKDAPFDMLFGASLLG